MTPLNLAKGSSCKWQRAVLQRFAGLDQMVKFCFAIVLGGGGWKWQDKKTKKSSRERLGTARNKEAQLEGRLVIFMELFQLRRSYFLQVLRMKIHLSKLSRRYTNR